MATIQKLKRSAVADKRPTITILELGELALNTYDGNLYTEQDTGGVGIGTTATLINPWSENYGGASIYYNNNVAIGKTGPDHALDVVGRTELDTLNASGISTFNDDVRIPDDKKLHFGNLGGAFGDLQIWHDAGAHSYIRDQGSGDLRIYGSGVDIRNNAGTASVARFTGEGVNVTGVTTTIDFYTSGIGTLVTANFGTYWCGTNGYGGQVGITSILDEDDFKSDSDTAVATQQSIKKYVDDKATAADLDYVGDGGGQKSIDLDAEVLSILGTANEIHTDSSTDNQLQIGLTDDIQIGDKVFHKGDANTALRFPANDTITAETDGSERLRITGIGSVGIGTNVPASDKGFTRVLEVEDGTSVSVKVSRTTGGLSGEFGVDSNEVWLGSIPNLPLRLGTNGNSRVHILGNGKVGINSVTPVYQLSVFGRSETSELNVIGLSTFLNDVNFQGSTHANWDSSRDELKFNDNTRAVFGSATGGDLQVWHGGTHSFIKNDTGDLRIRGDFIKLKNAADNATHIEAQVGAAVTLFHNNVWRVTTTGYGATVNGGLTVTGITTVGDTITGPAIITIDPAVVGNNTGLVKIAGNLQVDGTQTTINSTTLDVTDKIIGIASVATPSNTTADNSGIEVYGPAGVNKTLTWKNTGTNWTSSENFDIVLGKVYKVDNTEVLSKTLLTIPNAKIGIGGTTIMTNAAGQVGINTILSPAQPASVKLDVDGIINSTTGITINGVPVTAGGSSEDPVAMAIALG